MSVDFRGYTYSCGIGDLFSLDTALVSIRQVKGHVGSKTTCDGSNGTDI